MVVHYDPVLVAISILIAIVGAYTALSLGTHAAQQKAVGGFAGCLPCHAGLVLGSTIWSMHFIAMLALQLPVTVTYDVMRTALSLVLPIVATGLALLIVSKRLAGRASLAVAGVTMGFAISGMHYTGMSALEGCGLRHATEGVILATGIAIAASMVALWFVFRRRSGPETTVGAVILGLAVAGMHYTAMLSTSFVPLTEQVVLAAPVLASDMLAYGVAAITLSVCAFNMLMVTRDRMA